MKFAIFNLILFALTSSGPGNIGRYELEIETKSGEEYKAFTTIAMYETFQTNFDSNERFMNYLFNLNIQTHIDSISFYKNFYFIKYPQYEGRNEKLISILPNDKVMLAKSDILEMRFISFKKGDFGNLRTQLNIEEINLLQNQPYFSNMISIDRYQSGFWILSYNLEVGEKEVGVMMDEMSKEYTASRLPGENLKNSWIYTDLIEKWQKKLKKKNVLLLEVEEV